jgi:CheY-like chemotaxis protein
MARHWYSAHDLMGYGPVFIGQLGDMAQSHSLQPTGMVLEDERPEWIKASSARLFHPWLAVGVPKSPPSPGSQPMTTPSSDTILNQVSVLGAESLQQMGFTTELQEHRLLNSYRLQKVVKIPQLFPAGKVLPMELETVKQSLLPKEPDLSDRDSPPGPALESHTILLVEDEEGVRGFVHTILKRKGYTVLEASNGADALGKYEHFAGRIDLLVTDCAMPQMSGSQLAEWLVRSRPEMKVLFISGNLNDPVVIQSVTEGHHYFLQKPFSSEYLVNAVRELLDRAAAISRP